jgi:type II secretory pathway component PulF
VNWFIYKAVDRGGAHVSGTIEAVDRKSAVVALTEKGHFVTELTKEAKSHDPNKAQSEASALDLGRYLKIGSGRVSSKDVLAITTQLSTALRAGLPLLSGLELLRKQHHKQAVREMLGELVDAVSAGQSLSEAMAKHAKVFSPLYLSMVRVGETGGMLEQTTSQLADMLTREEKIKTNMKNASAYPIFVLCLGLISVTIVITVILPKIIDTLGADLTVLPLPTRILMAASSFIKGLFTSYPGWIVLAGIVLGFYHLLKWARTAGRLKCDTFKLRIPILGSVSRSIAVGRFARTLGALTGSSS